MLHLLQVHNTPDGHVTRDYKEGPAQLADLKFTAVDTSGRCPDEEHYGSHPWCSWLFLHATSLWHLRLSAL